MIDKEQVYKILEREPDELEEIFSVTMSVETLRDVIGEQTTEVVEEELKKCKKSVENETKTRKNNTFK